MYFNNKIDYGKPYQTYIIFIILESTSFQIALKRWSKSLTKQIEIYSKAGRKVYIIALSRKMPRFFDWLEKKMPIPEVKELFQKMKEKDVEVITEYAVPLILDNHQNYDTIIPGSIIADDAIIFGATANTVAMQWLALSGEIPVLSALFRSDRGVISKTLESEYSIGMSRMSFQTLAKNLNEISKHIMSSALPVDMEYPIIHIRKSFEEVKKFIEESIPSTWKSYSVKSSINEFTNESFSVLLGEHDNLLEHINDSHRNDFSKIRLFKHNDECCMEIISPKSIRVDSLFDKDMFLNNENTDDEYNDLWQHVFNKVFLINEPVENCNDDNEISLFRIANHARRSTLIIWAQYLISFSTFIQYKQYLIPEVYDMYIDEADLRLILGGDSANYAIKRLCSINYTCHLNTNKYAGVVFEEYYTSSPELRQLYLREIAKSLNPDVSLHDNLDALFMVSHYSGDILTKVPIHNYFSHHCFGESYDSLMNILERYNNEENEKKDNKENKDKKTDKIAKIHQWIDMRIDESRISPKYALVTGSDKYLYVRRFFLCGSNRF